MEKLFTRKGFNIIILFIDLIIIYASIILAFLIFEDQLSAYNDNFYAFLAVSPYIGLCYLIISHIFELDKPKDFTFSGVAYSVILTIVCLFFATMAISFLARKFAYPRSILVVSSMIQIALLSLWHLFINRKYLKATIEKNVLIIGYNESKKLAYKLLRTNGMWSKIKHIIEPENPYIYKLINNCDIIFLADDVEEIRKQELIEYCVMNEKNIYYEPRTPEILLFNTSFTQIDDTPILKVKNLEITTENNFIKRALDIALSSIALVLSIIPCTIIAMMLKIGGGSIFYRQERVTRDGKTFKIYKFRTMIENAEALSGPVLAQNTDNRITKLGNILRATRLDEIPQIINILKGEMSIVGPRPERPFFVDQFNKEIPEYHLRHKVKAGLTGLAQIQGKYNTSTRDKLKYDLLYINGYSLALDLKLIMQTLNILLRKSSTEGIMEMNDLDEQINKLSIIDEEQFS